jgi:hypothetical protein
VAIKSRRTRGAGHVTLMVAMINAQNKPWLMVSKIFIINLILTVDVPAVYQLVILLQITP